MRIFGKKPPTPAQVDEQIETARQQVDDYQQQQAALVEQIADGFGEDTAPLEQQHANIGLKLAALDVTLRKLADERKSAVLRELAAEFESRCQAISADTDELHTLAPKLEEARRQYAELQAQEQTLRSRINVAQVTMTGNLSERAQANGISSADLTTALAAIRARYPQVDTIVGRTADEARALKMAVSHGTPDAIQRDAGAVYAPSSGGKA